MRRRCWAADTARLRQLRSSWMGLLRCGRWHLRARIAEAKKDYARAEKYYRATISASHSSAQSWMDLGSFYRRRERWDDMLAAVESGAVAADPDHGPALADGASTLMKAGREPQTGDRVDAGTTWRRTR